MKTTIFACVLCALSTHAMAQSKVEIYGVVDLGLTKGNGGGATNPGANGTNKAWMMKQASASRLGFRGTEDLGNGMSVGFLMENRFQPDTGVSNTPYFMQSTISLTHKDVGTLWMGRDYAPFFWVAIKADPSGFDGVGQIGNTQYNDFKSNSDNQVRTNNTVGFKSKRFAGFSVDAAYSLREEAANSQVGINVQYQTQKIYAGLGYAKVQQPVVANAANNDELLNIALIYSFDNWRAISYYSNAKNKNFHTQSKKYTLGMDARIGSGRFKVAYTNLNSDLNRLDRQKFGIGYDYELSKLTRLYFDVGYAKQKYVSNNTAVGVGIRKSF